MPKFEPGRKPDRSKKEGDNLPSPRDAIPGIVEPRCHVCKSDYRKAIDKLIAMGRPYAEIGRMFQIDRRSISNHAKEHLSYEEEAVRRIIEQQALETQQDMEEGIQGALSRRVFLEVYLQKSIENLISGEIELTGKDALAVIDKLDKIDGQAEGAALDELRMQFNAFVQAIREICPPEQWHRILERTKELLGQQTAVLSPPKEED